MAPNSVSILNSLESNRNISGIAGLSKLNGRVYDNGYDDEAGGRDTGFDRYHEQIFSDQLLANTRLLQYYQKLCCEDKTACSMQKSALEALHRIYSLKLRPANLSDSPPLETRLQLELIQIINRPYGISDDQHTASPDNVARPDSPLWQLHDWSLKLTRAIIESGHLSVAMAKAVENHLTNLVETSRSHYPDRLTSQRSSTNFALLAHCLYKLVNIIGNLDIAHRPTLRTSFICNQLFPLACEFAAKEYPATVVDPISLNERFEASCKLDEPASGLDASGTSSGERLPGNQNDNDCNNSDYFDPHLLPPTHVCLEHLIYKLTLSSSADTQDAVVKFLQQKILENQHNDTGTVDAQAASHNSEAGKLALMSRIVALNIIGRVVKKLNLWNLISLPCLLKIPTLSLDCLLMKICKFQQTPFLKRIDNELRMEFVQAYLCELIINIEVENSQDQRHKLFVILTKLASRFLCTAGQPESSGVMKTTCSFYIEPLERKSKLNLVKKIAALYLDHKIAEPLILAESLFDEHVVVQSLKKECEHQMTKVIDSIADELLELLPNKKDHMYRIVLLLHRLSTSSLLRKQPVMDETVDKLLKLNRICLLDEESRRQVSVHCNPNIWYQWNWINLEFALKFPLKKQAQSHALILLDRILDLKLGPSGIMCQTLLNFASTLLGHLGFYEVTNTSRLYAGDHYNDRSLLLGSAHRIGEICAMCELIEQPPDWISSCIMSTLMSWSHSSRPSAGVDYSGRRLLTLILTKFDKFEPEEDERIDLRRRSFKRADLIDEDNLMLFKTRDNILLALMAAFNYDPNFLESHLCLLRGPATNSESHTKKYIKLWLDLVTKPKDPLWTQSIKEDSFTARSQVHISYQTLINIHRAHTEGRLTFPLIGLERQLNSARRAVLNWLSELNDKAILRDSPLKNFYADSIRQLKAIGQFT